MVVGTRQGLYNIEYFSGSQAAIYIGDIWVDEITSFSYRVSNTKTPIYGYASELYDDVSKGRVLIQGEFTINFKEAGYLFLILNRYQQMMNGKKSKFSPYRSSDEVSRMNIEAIMDNEMTTFDRNKMLRNLVYSTADEQFRIDAQKTLTGFSSQTRSEGGIDVSEHIFEAFEDAVWSTTQEDLDNRTRRADDPDLNPFEIYLSFGDFADDNSVNHTIQKISGVHITGSMKTVVANGEPIQETYTFIGRNLV